MSGTPQLQLWGDISLLEDAMKEKFATEHSRLTKPGLILPESERRQTELLAKILLFLLLFLITILAIVLFLNPHNDPQYLNYAFLLSGLLVFFAFSFTLNYYGNYNIAAYFLVTGAALTPWLSLVFDTSILEGDFVPLTYLAFSVLLSGILLPTHITIILALLQVSGLILAFISFPAILSVNWFSFLAFVILTSIFSILANNIIQNNFKKIDSLAVKLKNNEAHLLELSSRDYLTKLFNRRYMEETMIREIHRAEREQHSLGLIMLDIDGFKRINDTLGHAAGDLVLQEIGTFLSDNIRQSDIACRYGGDEFVLILSNSSQEATKKRADQLRSGAKNLEITFAGKSIDAVTLSLGIATYPDSGLAGEQLLKAADTALYHAKREGGNRVCAE